jgi:glycosyltransferase involved in cell wall biosynthesis
MDKPVSVVIICCNAAATIQKTLASAFLLTTDVVVVDSGSTDSTLSIIETTNAKLVQMEWLGFGATKNKGNEAAKWDWIVSLDADEVLSNELVAAITAININEPHSVYSFHRLNYLGLTPIKYGEWKNDWTVRLFNRQLVRWDDAPVHEKLILPPAVKNKKLNGWLHHYTAVNIDNYKQKLEKYAASMAEKYYAKGKKAPNYKIYISPVFSFLKYYIVHLGWMDGEAGWQISRAHALYTFKKYKKLKELHQHYKIQ